MENRKMVPEIRFSGFTDPWELRKLGDEVIEIFAGGDIDKSKTIENGKYPIYANALTNDGIVGYYDNYYRVKAPAVTVTGRGEVGFAQARMADFTPVVRLLAIRSNHDCYFLENAINNHKIVIESTGVPQLTIPQLSSYCIFFSRNDEEEIRVGEYFHKLSNLITLHQRKLEKLKTFKKAMLDKMFPKNGELVPEIRFSGFTDPWEQRKVYDFAEVIGGGTPSTSNPDYWDGDIDWYAPAEIGEQIYVKGSIRKITREGLNHSSAKILPAHRTVLFTSRAGIGNMAILQRVGATNQGFQSLVCRDDINPYFIFSMGNLIKAKAEHVAAGSTFAEISGKKLGELEFMMPEYTEQNKIGDFFERLDEVITLHQRKQL